MSKNLIDELVEEGIFKRTDDGYITIDIKVFPILVIPLDKLSNKPNELSARDKVLLGLYFTEAIMTENTQVTIHLEEPKTQLILESAEAYDWDHPYIVEGVHFYRVTGESFDRFVESKGFDPNSPD